MIGASRPVRLQLWSCHYAPEPTGNAPVTTLWAKVMTDRGYDVDVVAAHPHYPDPIWGTRLLPYRELRDGIPVLRLPVWPGRRTAAQRMRKELTLVASQFAATPSVPRPDIAVVASPSFPHLLPAIVTHRMRRTPWVLWLHDILPDGAVTTGLVGDAGLVANLSRRLERTAYENAAKIVILSPAFHPNLAAKGVPSGKVRIVLNPATRVPIKPHDWVQREHPVRLLAMGNIGFTQGLTELVRDLEASDAISDDAVKLVITGTGTAADEVAAEVRSARVEMLGIVDDARLETELQRASVAVVSQHYLGGEFNLPSKLMNYMAYGLPVLALVRPDSEVARIVEEAGCGWVVDSSRPELLPLKVAEIIALPQDKLAALGKSGWTYAQHHFTVDAWADGFEEVFNELRGPAVRGRSANGRSVGARGS